jgi:hypothetical protein
LPAWPHVKLPCLPLTDSHPDGYLWKRDYIAIHAAGHPLAWIDDDFAVPADHDWAAARTAAGYSTLLIQPDPYLGLDVENIEVIRRWALALELPRSA